MKQLLFHSLYWSFAFAAVQAATDSSLEQAQRALDDGLPSVAIHRLQQTTSTPGTEDEKAQAQKLLVRAYNDAGRYADTLSLFEAQPKLKDEALHSLGQAYVGLGQKEKALEVYQKLSDSKKGDASFILEYSALLQSMDRLSEADALLTGFLAKDPSGHGEVLLNLASLRLAEGKPQEAWDILTKMAAPNKEAGFVHDFLAAKTLLALDRVDEAGEFLNKLQNPPPFLTGDVLLVRAEYLRKTNDLAAAEKSVEKFIDENPRMPGLADVFQRLDAIYGEQGASSGTELRRWSQDESEKGREALALYYLARNEARNSKLERSQQFFRDFLQKFPTHALAAEARFSLASSLLTSGDFADALDTLQSAPPDGKTGFLRGMALAAQSKYPEAAASFLLAAQTPVLKAPALFNAAICNTRAGVSEKKNQAFQEIAAADEDGKVTQKLRLAQALFLASKHQPEAGEMLKKLANAEDHEIAQQARLALAEWEYVADDIPAARAQLRLISSVDPSERQRADYLAIFLADTGKDDTDAQAATLAETFLKNYPDSSFEADVRLKLGEILFRKGDYLGARGQFAAILEDSASSPLADKAAFLSAQAMSRSMDPQAMEEAIETYDNVVKGGGPLALRARLAQATLFNALKRKTDALGVLDRLLESQPDPELRAMALIEKGDTLFSQGVESPENYRQAIAAWQVLASDPATSPTWRNQALTKMGAAYEKLGDNGAALNCYYNVFSAGQKGEPEYFWFYKAGFDAGHLLESQNLWNEAIAVYEKIGALEGPRAEEARNRVNKLRLENFLWEN